MPKPLSGELSVPLTDEEIEDVKRKLRWGMGQPMFSTDFNHRECKYLLSLMTRRQPQKKKE